MTKQDQPLIFILQPSSSQSQREKELQVSERKAHAAKVAHARRRHVRGVGQVRQGRAITRTASGAMGSRRPDQAADSSPDDYWIDEPAHEDVAAALLVLPQHAAVPLSPHGSSDPFRSQAIPITPRVNQVLQYATQTLACLFATSYVRRMFSGPWKQYFDPKGVEPLMEHVKSFSWTWEWSSAEEGSLSSYVSMYATSMTRFLPPHIRKEYSVMALTLRTRSLEVLRKRISDLDGTRRPDMALIMNVMRLFRMDSFAGDVKGARLHAKMIRGFAESVPELQKKGHFICITVYNDIVSATNQLRRPLLDYDNWIQAFLDECKLPIAHYLPPEPTNEKGIHHSVSLYQLRRVMNRLTWYLSFVKDGASFTPTTLAEAEHIHRWVIITAQQDMAIILNLYVDLTEDDEPLLELHLTNIALTLALMMTLQKSMWDAMINGTDLCDSSRVGLPRLESVMKSILQTSTLEELHYYREAHFWVFFVGAQMEQHNLKTSRRSPSRQNQGAPHSLWFSNMLVQQARFLNLWKWSDARGLVQSFAFNEFWEPSPSVWYETLVQDFRDSTESVATASSSEQSALMLTRPPTTFYWSAHSARISGV